jgi:NAD+ kinase
MKVAIYSRVIDFDQQSEIQQMMDELVRENVEPVIYQPFFEKIKASSQLPSRYSVFAESKDLDDSIDFLISLGGDGTLLDTITLVRDKIFRCWVLISVDWVF